MPPINRVSGKLASKDGDVTKEKVPADERRIIEQHNNNSEVCQSLNIVFISIFAIRQKLPQMYERKLFPAKLKWGLKKENKKVPSTIWRQS